MIAPIVALALSAASVHADWRFTAWGMTPEELEDASDGGLTFYDEPVATGSGLKKHAVEVWVSGSFTFDATYFFDSVPALAAVTLHLRDKSKGYTLYDELLNQFGEPRKEELKPIVGGESHIAVWYDADDNNRLVFYSVGDFVALEYTPLNPSGGF